MGRRFAITYVAIAGCLFGIYVFPFDLFGARSDWLAGYLAVYAQVAGALLAVFERDIVVDGAQIVGRFPLRIIRNCDAAEVSILFASAVLAFPAPLGRRLVALPLGLASVAAANVARICCLYYVGVHAPVWFRVAHEEIWPLLLVASTAFTFLAWARYMSGGAVAA